MVVVSLPYYHYRTGGGSLYLEAFLSQHLTPEEVCLLASKKPVSLSSEPRGVVAEPWGTPEEVLSLYVSRASMLLEGPPPPVGRIWGWFLRRLAQELNRLIAGGLVGPPVEPEKSEKAVRNRLARRLCRDILSDVIGGRRAIHVGRVWRVVDVRLEDHGVVVLREGGGDDRIVGWLASRNEGVRRALEGLAR